MCGAGNLSGVLAEPRGEVPQNAMNFAQFFFGQAYELVVQFDSFQRLDKQRVTAAAGPMNHALDTPLAPRDHRDHEAVIANRDEVFLERAVFVMRAQEAFERMLDGCALPFDIAPQPRQSDAGMIRQSPVGQNLTAKLAGQLRRIGGPRSGNSGPREW